MAASALRAVAAAVVVALAGCGASDGGSPGGASASQPRTASIGDAGRALEQAGSFSFEAEFFETKRATGERERYLATEGAVDLERDAWRTVVDLTWLGDELASRAPDGDERVQRDPGLSAFLTKPVEVRWTGGSGFAHLGGRWLPLTRPQLRSGLVGRVAEEPARLVSLLSGLERVRSATPETADGVATTRIAVAVDARRAWRGGIPAETYRAFESALYGPHLRLAVWVDDERLPRRIAYWFSKDDVRSGGRVVIPAKTIHVRYRLFGFGEDVDTARPPTGD